MKAKFIATLTAVLLIFGSMCAVASTSTDATLTDGVNGVIQITGIADAGEVVNIMILNPSATLTSVATDVTGIQYQNEVYADKDGNFSLDVTLNIPSDYIDGTFEVYAMAESWGSVYQKQDGIYFLLINERVLLQSFREKKDNIVLDENGKILYEDVLGLDKIDDGEISIYNLYKKSITDDGIKKVGSALLGTKASDTEEFRKEFALETIVAAIAYNTKDGYGHVEDVLTLANCEYAGIDASDYLDLDEDEMADANAYIMDRVSSLTSDNIESIIDDAAEDASDSGRGNGGSTGGGGGGGGSYRPPVILDIVDTNAPQITPSPKPDENFSDIADLTWAKDAINTLYADKVIDGVGDGRFAPNDNLTREQAVKIICLFFGIEVDGTVSNEFADVADTAWYTPYINAAVKNGIVNGVGNGNFGVGSFITREDFAVIISRISKKVSQNKETSYTDKVDVADYAIGAVDALYNEGVITGYSDGTFRPKANITRAEACVILSRLK